MDRRSKVRAGIAAAVAQWIKFFSRAEYRRLDPEKFATFARIIFTKHPLPPQIIADLLMRPTASNREALDPRLPHYLEGLLKQKIVNTAAVLGALYQYSTTHTQIQSDPSSQNATAGAIKEEPGVDSLPKEKRKVTRWRCSYSSEAVVLWQLARYVNQGTGIRTGRDVIEIVKVLIRWISLFIDVAAAFSRDAFNAMHTQQQRNEVMAARDAFVLFFMAFSENKTVVATLDRPITKSIRKHLANSLETFIPHVMQVNPNFATRLDLFRTQHLVIYESIEKKEAAIAEINSYMDSLMGLDSFQVSEIPILNTRAGLYIYISAALVGRPLVDDVALFTYLHNRYQGDLHTAAVQLILASFDVLANAVFRNEGARDGHLLKSFVVNKIPLILVALASSSSASMYPFNSELCITEALGQVDTNVFPTLSGMFDISNNSSSFQDSVRQDFCFACQLHGLISQSATENLLGEITYQSLPDEGRYVREVLFRSCLVESERTQKLIAELDLMNGNVGAAAQAVVDVISNLCRNKETMILKQLCSQLACRPSSLDILLLFNPAHKLLHPLCELLDGWGDYDEDQGEYQPVYEEFGSILLLLLALVYRYNLSPADLGIRSPNSFIRRFLSTGSTSRPRTELSEQEKSHLSGWITGLFGESAGLGDELMASCPPQDFYLLMPTLFNNIVIALSTRTLSDETLRSGLEYLLDVFLLPSLVPAMLYLSNQLWQESHAGQNAIIKILHFILRSQSSSGEAMAMFGAVLNIVAKPLEHALRSYQRQDPKSQEVEPLLRAFKDNLAVSRRTGGANHNELESWTSSHTNSNNTPAGNSVVGNLPNHGANTVNPALPFHGGLSAAIRHTIQNLVHWVQQPVVYYTHRQTLAALKMLGAKHLLNILLDELQNLTDSGQGSMAYDVVTAMICAPDTASDTSTISPEDSLPPVLDETTGQLSTVTPPLQRRNTLREVLKVEAEDWRTIQKGPNPGMAEIVVRLHRRVEAQMAMPPPSALVGILAAGDQLGGLGVGVGGVGGDVLMGDAAMAAAVAVAAGDNGSVVGGVEGHQLTLDTTGSSGGDLGLGSAVGDLGGLGSATGSVVGGAGGAGGTNNLDLDGDNIFSGLPSLTGDFDPNSFHVWDMEGGY
ncbi:putative mediator of RNA polymerase II transcription subunit 5 [Podospora fimiseda]|uniref:Mediator of RNA polymerase II transcription subunit 5 n=1 Tax=Podospora fimiseda TaxID=252190 RepID=A0AAN7GPJ6_9PEZI|nr:putative mediator of RNA polymerase II transcription subunit 5 [Podospora fimiseda]